MKALKPLPEPRKALETVREMARYGKEKEALWGIQVINEPHMFTQDEHWFLKKYYEEKVGRNRTRTAQT